MVRAHGNSLIGCDRKLFIALCCAAQRRPSHARPDWWHAPGWRRIFGAMPEHDPTRTDRLALYMRANASEQAARDDAVRVVHRWNGALASGRAALWSPTIRCDMLAGMPWLDVYCPSCKTSRAIEIRTLDRQASQRRQYPSYRRAALTSPRALQAS